VPQMDRLLESRAVARGGLFPAEQARPESPTGLPPPACSHRGPSDPGDGLHGRSPLTSRTPLGSASQDRAWATQPAEVTINLNGHQITAQPHLTQTATSILKSL